MENQSGPLFLFSLGRGPLVGNPSPKTEPIGPISGVAGMLSLQFARRLRSLNPRRNSMKRTGRHEDLTPVP